MKHRIILAIFAVLLSFPAHSGPARKDPVYLIQPDGTGFSAKIRGDEFMRIVTTEAGNAIIQEPDGWWCYACYDAEGRKYSSGHKVGHETPAEIISRSRNIPVDRLAGMAKAKRASVPEIDEPLMPRVLKANGLDTKSDVKSPVTKHGLIILAQFKDVKFTYDRQDFINMLTKSGYNSNGATGSAKEYFDAQFGGKVEFSFDVSPIVTLPGNISRYGSNSSDGTDTAPEEMIADACNLVDDEIDFSIYDDDNDGVVDNVFVFFAGGDEAEGAGEDRIWSHAWYIFSGAGKKLILDGKRIDRYACTSELTRSYQSPNQYREVLAGIGTFCHEYFHTFGIPDMYDTDYEESGGTSAGLWTSTSLMDAGNQNNNGNTPPNLNAIEREMLGISKPKTIDKDGGYTLQPIHLDGMYYRLDTDNEDEYYLLECRAEEGWDKYIGGSGMLVYHIDKSDRSTGYSDKYGSDLTADMRWEMYNEVNSRPDHQCADLVEADSRKDSFGANESESFYASQKNIRSIFFPHSEANSLLPDSRPGLTYWSGAEGKISISEIRRYDGGNNTFKNAVTFNVLGFSGTELPPDVSVNLVDVFIDAAIINFASPTSFDGEAVVQWGRTGGTMETVRVKPFEPRFYSITLEGLQPDNKTYTVRIHFEKNGLTGKQEEISFMTKKRPAVNWPFIYMNSIKLNGDRTIPVGSLLPLRLYNAGKAEEITWEFDGSPITAEGNGYFIIRKSGTLKAHIIWQDGSEEVIIKEIIAR